MISCCNKIGNDARWFAKWNKMYENAFSRFHTRRFEIFFSFSAGRSLLVLCLLLAYEIFMIIKRFQCSFYGQNFSSSFALIVFAFYDVRNHTFVPSLTTSHRIRHITTQHQHLNSLSVCRQMMTVTTKPRGWTFQRIMMRETFTGIRSLWMKIRNNNTTHQLIVTLKVESIFISINFTARENSFFLIFSDFLSSLYRLLSCVTFLLFQFSYL